MKTKLLIVLGSPNSPLGELSEISISRLNLCLKKFEKGNLILCTGGWGEHFNTSKKPHAFYSQKYLIDNGIPEDAFLKFALSKNSVDDAVKVKSLIEKLKNIDFTVITSDYHLERVKLIFNEILSNYSISYEGVQGNLTRKEYQLLVNHEKKAIQSILENGLYY